MNNNFKQLIGIEVDDDIDAVREKISKLLASGTLHNAGYYELAIVCHRLCEFKLAKQSIKRFSLPQSAKLPDLLNYLAFLIELDEFEFVEKRLASLCVHYQLAPIFHMHGTVLSQMGKLVQAKTQLIKAFKLEARGETLLAIIALLSDEELINYPVPNPTLRYGNTSDACFHAALSKIYQAKSNIPLSIDHAEKSHASIPQAEKNQDSDEYFNTLIQRLPSKSAIQKAREDDSAAASASAINPIFLISLPRTGSTLLENVMSRHSDIVAVGEISLFSTIMANEAAQPSFKNSRKSRYLKHVSERFENGKHIFDKSLSNLYVLPELIQEFPNAKFIFLHRQFENMAWSCFQTHFSQGLGWTNDIHNIRQRYQFFNDVSARLATSTLDMIEVTYEEMIAKPIDIIDQVQAFLNLAQEDLVNKPAKGIIKTASVTQVRKAIYNSSLALDQDLKRFIQQA